MGLQNCKKCGRLFNRTINDNCQVCVKEEEEAFFTVRDYLRENKRASANEVADGTGIELSLIVKFIREGRLSTVDNPMLSYPCDACEEPITNGRYCKPCKEKLSKGLQTSKDQLLESKDKKSKQSEYLYKRDYR